MHQACVYESKKQYDKSNGVLTGVIRDAFNNGVVDQSLKNAIDKFQNKYFYNSAPIKQVEWFLHIAGRCQGQQQSPGNNGHLNLYVQPCRLL